MDNVLYTDGHGIKVTTSDFFTGKNNYRIDGILNARMNLIKAHYARGIWLMLFGIAAVVVGILHLLPESTMPASTIANILVTSNRIAIAAGIFLFVAGILVMAVQHNKYSVHIVTAEGEKDPIISEKKDYIHQIVSALDYALRLRSDFQP
jgi:hypothetical protein